MSIVQQFMSLAMHPIPAFVSSFDLNVRMGLKTLDGWRAAVVNVKVFMSDAINEERRVPHLLHYTVDRVEEDNVTPIDMTSQEARNNVMHMLKAMLDHEQLQLPDEVKQAMTEHNVV